MRAGDSRDLADWRSRSVLSVAETRDGPFEGRVATSTIYAEIRAGRIPSVHLGRRLLVPVRALRELLGEIPRQLDDAQGA